jgi:dihydrofolate reductase
VRGDPSRAIERLKRERDGDLIVYGHGQLGQSLLAHGLLDELHLLVCPAFVGHGQLAFRTGLGAGLKLRSAEAMPTGAVQLVYEM